MLPNVRRSLRRDGPLLTACLLVPGLATVACSRQGDSSSAGTARESAAVAGRPAEAKPPLTDDGIWLVRSDSALRAIIPGLLFGADSAALNSIHHCDADGDDSPPMLMAAARIRPLGHDTVQRATDDTGAVVREVPWHVEVRSVAQLTPARGDRDTTLPSPGSTAANEESYAAGVAVRTDTLTLTIRGGPGAARPWQLCSVGGAVRGAPTPFWMFITDAPHWVHVARWTPANASWVRVRTLSDSVKLLAR